MENKKVTVCLETLFNRLTGHDTKGDFVPTKYGYIQKETDEDKEWFDLITDDGTPCMDGETCEVLEETEQYILLQEIDEQIPFKLSREEFEIATVEYRKTQFNLKNGGNFTIEKNRCSCTKYTQKRGNFCTIKCSKGNELILNNTNLVNIKDITYCPICGVPLLEIGYANFTELSK